MPITVVEPTATPPEPTATPTLVVSTPAPPSIPLGLATADLNVRSGPGTGYPILGLLRAGQPAKVTGLSPDGDWWQIKFSGVANERGWVSARYITAQNTANVPVVQPPAQPPKPTPVAISEWQGEYYNNMNLSGAPVVVRNDEAISFDWGVGAPVAGVRADNFSVRWTRSLNFPAGTYRFYVRVDDGVRLWVDDDLVIDQWRDTTPTTYIADIALTEGTHSLRLEYYERNGTALAQLTWEWLETFPDWKGEYFDNPSLSDAPVLIRNDPAVYFSWGPNTPGSGVPADNFSVRWTRKADFDAGTYRFQVKVDDGARLWVDDTLVINDWQDGGARPLEANYKVSSGQHRLKVEYYERSGEAQIEVEWQKQDEPVNNSRRPIPAAPTPSMRAAS